MRKARYGTMRYLAVYDSATLVCVCLYKKGTQAVPLVAWSPKT
jgi:hypothetical protein